MPQPNPLLSSADIASRIAELAKEISNSNPTDLLVVGLLKGCFIFVADLTRALNQAGTPTQIEFMKVSSYGKEKQSSGVIRVDLDVEEDIVGKKVLLVDDIVDTGNTLRHVKNLLLEKGAEQVTTCVLLDKPSGRTSVFKPDHIGFTVGNKFIVGYGIDYAENYRDLPYIGQID